MEPLHHEEIAGRGTPFVLLHGVLDAPSAWARVARALGAAGRRAVLVHARGHGGSGPWSPGMAWSPQADAADVADLLRRVAPDGAHLVGHSRGGTSACWVAAEDPRLARSLAVVCSPPQATEAFRARFRHRLAQARDGRERAALEYLSRIPDDDFPQHALRRFERPALVVEAGDDPLYSPTDTLFWRAFLPYARFERVEGGHRFFADDPGAARLAAMLLDLAAEAERA
ncbi:MAG TPA: alpha/beta fold hydrolase [Candidatus Thermoplasmatota archaeon]|nr:alpha/beta fold hydrolase [Candidatus Thermoplasmatota archaeon]